MVAKTLDLIVKAIMESGFRATLEGVNGVVLRVNTLEDAQEGDLSFLSNPKYSNQLATTRASAVIVPEDCAVPDGLRVIRCSDPYAGVTVAIMTLHGLREHPRWPRTGQAYIDSTAVVPEDANVGPSVTIGRAAQVGRNAVIYSGCYIGDRVRIGDDVVLYPNVVIYEDCVLGDRVAIHAGSVIGQDGLGYAPVGKGWMKIPQVGRVVIEDDVEIGACCAIDRATLGETRIGKGTKFSDLIAIGHGTKIGPHCMFVAQVGVAGSVTIGEHVTLAGQVGVAGHLRIGDGASVAAQSGVRGDIPPGAKHFGYPATDIMEAKRQMVAVQRLPEWSRDVKRRIEQLEAELAALKRNLGGEGPVS